MFNDVVNEEREAKGTSYKQHVTLFQKTMGVKWNELSKSEKEDWNHLAADKQNIDAVFK